jgi:hypothetical protein
MGTLCLSSLKMVSLIELEHIYFVLIDASEGKSNAKSSVSWLNRDG